MGKCPMPKYIWLTSAIKWQVSFYVFISFINEVEAEKSWDEGK